MTIVEEVRAKHLNLANALKEHRGIRRIVEDLYPDQAHFVYELLQNAEDAGATSVTFRLCADGLTFEHDGRPFTERDVYGITDIGESNKIDDDAIGRFGVGFKAVFAYSETPTIYSPTYSFRIEELVLPWEVAPVADLNGLTRFIFPFNNPKKSPKSAYAEVELGLSELSEMALLFLPNLKSISWNADNGEGGEVLCFTHAEGHLEILRQPLNAVAISSHFLRFDSPVDGLSKQHISVAYPLQLLPDILVFDHTKPLASQLRIVPAEPGQVAVFFPAEKETSGLRFHLHAPFVPELSRASIKETDANNPLFEQLARLTAQSLHRIRDIGLLNTDFLSVLPNRQDTIPPRYQGIRQEIFRAMNNEPLTPTQARTHAPAKELLQAKASLKALLNSEDLALLVESVHDLPAWSISAPQRNSNADRLLSSLEINDWDVGSFVELLTDKFDPNGWQYPDDEMKGWLNEKSIEWHQHFYAFLYRELSPEDELTQLSGLEIIRLKNGSYAQANECYFPSSVGQDEGFPRIDERIYSAGGSKAQQEASRKCLAELGVREVGEPELVEALLKERYSRTGHNPRAEDMKRFVALVESEPARATMFSAYYIFEDESGSWRTASGCYLDVPLLETGLKAYYQAWGKDGKLAGLAKRYPDDGLSREKFVSFAKAVGVRSALSIVKCSCRENPEWKYLSSVGGQSSNLHVDEDYSLPGFLKATITPNDQVSALIWRTLDAISGSSRVLQAAFQRNRSWGAHFRPSTLIHQLKTTSWVPQTDGRFVTPEQARSDLLPAGFPFDAGKKWLKAVNFGEEAEKRSAETRQKQSIAKELGFDDGDALADAQWFARLNPDERRSFKREIERRTAFSLPVSESANPERRALKVGDLSADAPGKIVKNRTRSVSVGLGAVKDEADQYLRQQYTNSDGEMICQICKSNAPLPFRLADGRYYVEKVEFHRSADKRHFQNYIALCPNHAAMFKHVLGSGDLMIDMLMACEDGNLEIILADNDSSIYFTQTHLADLKVILGSS
jgi:hypothetical protein